MPKTTTALFIGYAHLEELVAAAQTAEHYKAGPLYGAQALAMLGTFSRAGYPIVSVEAHVQLIAATGHVHYWYRPMAEHFENPFTAEEKAAQANALDAWQVIESYLAANGIRAAKGMAAFPKGESRLSGDFAGLRWTKADLWQPAPAAIDEQPAEAAAHV